VTSRPVLEKETFAMTRKALLAGTALVSAVVAGLGFCWPFRDRTPALKLPGVVEVHEVRLGSKIGGRVEEVLVREGDLVQPGQTLVRFEAPELLAQQDQWQARLRAAENVLARAMTGPRQEEKDAADAATEAAKAHWKQLEAGARAEELRQAQAQVKSAETVLKLADQELRRQDWLMAQTRHGGTPAEHDVKRADVGRARAQLDLAKARLDLLNAGTHPREVEEAAALFRQAQAQARQLHNGTRSEDVAEAEAQAAEIRGKLREIEVNLAEREVKAPSLAVVEVLAVRKGDLVAAGQPVVRALRAEDLWVKVYVPETELGKTRLGQAVEVIVDGYPGQTFDGVIEQIAGVSEFTPRNVQSIDERRHQVFGVKVRVANPQGLFKAGMAAEVRLPLLDLSGQ
jgi:HlyD family secretion protein